MYRIPDVVNNLLTPWLTFRFTGKGQDKVYLTFDDGPDPECTPLLLKLLNDYGAKATFFVTGEKAAANPEIMKTIHESGHAIHLHSWNHHRLRILALSFFKKDIRKCSELIDSKIYRPPYGRIPLPHLIWLKSKGFNIILWNVNGKDYRSKPVSEKKAEKTIKAIRPGDIILLHDRNEFSHRTLPLARRLLVELSRKNIIFERIL